MHVCTLWFFLYNAVLAISPTRSWLRPGLPDFFGTKTKTEKYTKSPRTIPNVPKMSVTKVRKMDQVSIKKIYPNPSLQDPPKFTQIWIFGLKTNHLATLAATSNAENS
jgi:hypothetical protein